jgi:Cd2+/Zn2+-exporting ATPase
MSSSLDRLPFAVGLSRQATRVIRQNVVVALGVSAVLVVATALGYARIAQAVILHEGSTLIVIVNALRLFAYRG